MKQAIELALSKLFPVRPDTTPKRPLFIVERTVAPNPRIPPQWIEPLREGEDGIGMVQEHPHRVNFANGIERVQFEQDLEAQLGKTVADALWAPIEVTEIVYPDSHVYTEGRLM